MDWIDVRLWWHNLWLPLRNWRMRRKLLPQWVAEGRDPAMFPRAGPIDRKTYDWAVESVRDKTE